MLKASLEGHGVNFLMSAQTEAILGGERVTGVRFKDGTEVAADLVVMAVGIRPNIALAQRAGLRCERGVIVDDTLQTLDPRIYAVGEWRSEERRGGEECVRTCRARGWPYHLKKK